MSPSQASPPSPDSYSTSPTLSHFLQPPTAFLSQHPHIDCLICGALVTSPTGAVLLVRRAPHDSWPLKWEVPGGCIDADDASLVAAAVRELWEETRLRARAVKAAVRLSPPEDLRAKGKSEALVRDMIREKARVDGDVCLFEDGGRVWAKLTAWVDVEDCEGVRIDPEEHDDWRWVTEEEVLAETFSDGRPLDFVSDGVRRSVLEGMTMWKEENNKSIMMNGDKTTTICLPDGGK